MHPSARHRQKRAGHLTRGQLACQDAVAFFREMGDEHGEGIALGKLQAARAAQQA